MPIRPFHVAFPVHDLATTRHFYESVLGCKVGRTADQWIDFNLFGHQVTAHLCSELAAEPGSARPSNTVDGQPVPVLHWGVILEMADWETLAASLQAQQVKFVIDPYLRFAGEVGEQATMFLLDPSGNALEFKAFGQDESIFMAG